MKPLERVLPVKEITGFAKLEPFEEYFYRSWVTGYITYHKRGLAIAKPLWV